ncbi:MAG TPA: hypothetical protein VIB39_17680 [Candidatus Angelobacter sp.]
MSQAKSGINGRTYRNDNIGLTYAIPQGLAADPKMQIPQDPAGREFIILALWDNPRHTPIPRITFLYETKEAPAGLSAEEIALRYLHSLERNRDGYKMSEPKKLLSAGFAMWRMDYWRPDDAGQSYNSAIIVPLKDRRLLFIQMNAASQNELDSLVGSLNNLQLDKR